MLLSEQMRGREGMAALEVSWHQTASCNRVVTRQVGGTAGDGQLDNLGVPCGLQLKEVAVAESEDCYRGEGGAWGAAAVGLNARTVMRAAARS